MCPSFAFEFFNCCWKLRLFHRSIFISHVIKAWWWLLFKGNLSIVIYPLFLPLSVSIIDSGSFPFSLFLQRGKPPSLFKWSLSRIPFCFLSSGAG
uniref:Uncharacterized protein n=1 Tax=Kalanchoe fedtschenkoi TaxID=63787 RepID=A0A7N0SYW4_KALFE